MFKIFLSHSGSDENIARKIQNKAQNMGFETYMYQDDPQPGKNLPKKLEYEIKQSDCVLALITNNSLNSPTVQQEIGFARGQDKWIIPVVQKGISHEKFGFLQGNEVIKFDPKNDETGLKSINNYLEKIKYKLNEKPDKVDFGLLLTAVIFILGITMLGSQDE